MAQTQMEKLRAAKIKQEELAAKNAAAAKAALTPAPAGAVPIPAAAPNAQPGQPQMQTLKITIVGVLKQRDEKGEEKGVSQLIDLKVPLGFPKENYEQIMAQVWGTIIKQVGGLQNKNEDGTYTFYKDELFERYGATIHEVVGVSL